MVLSFSNDLHTNQVTLAAKKAREKIVEGNQRSAGVVFSSVKPIGKRPMTIPFWSRQTFKSYQLIAFLEPLVI